MFNVTARGVYGLSALVELCLSFQQGPRQIRDIAKTHNIPQHYLEQILVILKKSGIVKSFRGAQGGYALAQHPSQIRLEEVLSLLEGKLEVLTEQHRGNSLSFFWKGLENCIGNYLDKTLEELVRDMQTRQKPIMYSI